MDFLAANWIILILISFILVAIGMAFQIWNIASISKDGETIASLLIRFCFAIAFFLLGAAGSVFGIIGFIIKMIDHPIFPLD